MRVYGTPLNCPTGVKMVGFTLCTFHHNGKKCKYKKPNRKHSPPGDGKRHWVRQAQKPSSEPPQATSEADSRAAAGRRAWRPTRGSTQRGEPREETTVAPAVGPGRWEPQTAPFLLTHRLLQNCTCVICDTLALRLPVLPGGLEIINGL